MFPTAIFTFEVALQICSVQYSEYWKILSSNCRWLTGSQMNLVRQLSLVCFYICQIVFGSVSFRIQMWRCFEKKKTQKHVDNLTIERQELKWRIEIIYLISSTQGRCLFTCLRAVNWKHMTAHSSKWKTKQRQWWRIYVWSTEHHQCKTKCV